MTDIRPLYEKYRVERTDGRSAAGEKHHGCRYFVLDIDHDPFARAALEAYAKACAERHPMLAADLMGFASSGEFTMAPASAGLEPRRSEGGP